MRILLAGGWAALIEGPAAKSSNGSASPTRSAEEETRRTADCAVAADKAGNLGKAAASLQSLGVAKADEATSNKVRRLMCSHADRPIPSADLITTHRDAVLDMIPEAVSVALAKSVKGGAADKATIGLIVDPGE